MEKNIFKVYTYNQIVNVNLSLWNKTATEEISLHYNNWYFLSNSRDQKYKTYSVLDNEIVSEQ